MKGKWSSGKIAGVIAGGVAAFILLLISLIASIIKLPELCDGISNVLSTIESDYLIENNHSGQKEDQPYDYYEDRKDNPSGDDKSDSGGSNTWSEKEGYYFLGDAVRKDLTYQVKWCSYQYVLPENDRVKVEFSYPEINGENVPNLEAVNNAIMEEMEIIEEYVQDMPDYLSDEENYLFRGTGYVTYMNEDVLSVVYKEYEYYYGQDLNDDEFYQSNLISLNIDMKTGMVINNTNLIDVDDSFAVDFRIRCEEQNGPYEYLTTLSDQEIASLLSNKDTLVAFYTPMGMEIGINYYYGWMTVTYEDYKNFIKEL